MRAGTERSGIKTSGAVVGTAWGQVGLIECGGAVVLLALADDPAEVREVLEREQAEATRTRQAIELAGEVAGRIEQDRGFDGIPFEVSGTTFQKAVWQELTRIPRGEVVTYRDLARRIGRPTSSRAVGAACGANPVALIVPCHRVIGSGGALGGYRWGAERKARILRDEGALPAASGGVAVAG